MIAIKPALFDSKIKTMNKDFYNVSLPVNKPIQKYGVSSQGQKQLKCAVDKAYSQIIDIPMFIGGNEIRTGKKKPIKPPHNHQYVIGHYHQGTPEDVKNAIKAALEAKPAWEDMIWQHRANIFLKAADLIANKYRYELNAATMIVQSKNCYQAEKDSVFELIDLIRSNVKYITEIYTQQHPISTVASLNKTEQKPLEGFVFALTPFNFTAIASNLPICMALMGNVVVWKPSNAQIYPANLLMKIFKEAGLPNGVINMIYVPGPEAADVIFSHPDFAGIHFTGSTRVFQEIWKKIGLNIPLYKNYPKIVGETGGKNFIVLHHSANIEASATSILRSAFEHQGQTCSAASMVYVASSIWPKVKEKLLSDLATSTMGPVEEFTHHINAVIDESSFDKLEATIKVARETEGVKIIAGGNCDKSIGYFIEPTIIETTDPFYTAMQEELFGPILTVYVYQDERFEETLKIIDSTLSCASTGSIMANDRNVIKKASKALRYAAVNFYIDDKCPGEIVGQQPFGGHRGLGKNDKSGYMINLLKWASPRAISEILSRPSLDYTYPAFNREPHYYKGSRRKETEYTFIECVD